MKVVILAGGYGTRLSEYTKTIPKPMVKIGNKPILFHIMNTYKKYGFNEFIILLGYKGSLIKDFFKKNKHSFKIKFLNTGLNTMTGGRLRQVKKYITDDIFFATYGDGIANINIKKLLKHHKKFNRMVTITAVKPPARFGALKISRSSVLDFREKLKNDESWINGGFFIIKKKFLDTISDRKTYLEKKPFVDAARKGQMIAYKHNGFWQCMDTKRDVDNLNNLFKQKKLNWL